MEKVIFTDSWERFFVEFGLKTFEDFYDYKDGEIVNKNYRRNVCKFVLGDGAERKTFFMKRFCSPHIKDILFAWKNAKPFCSQAEYEWQNANLLLDKGFGTYKPVCFGQQNVCGIERKSFLITEEIKDVCFVDYVAKHWLDLPQPQKETILASLGQTIRKLHDAGISMPDMYVWHIYIAENASKNTYEFSFIDLHRMRRSSVPNANEKLQNLGRLRHSMIDKYFDESEWLLLVESYAGKNYGGDKLLKKVTHFAMKVSAKRNPKPY